MARRRLAGYEPQYGGQGDPNQPMRLERRGGSWVKKLIISLVVTIVVISLLAFAGLLVGNYFCEKNLGVSVWTIFELAGDIKKDDENLIVTNGYDKTADVKGFYATVNGNLFLDADADTQGIIEKLIEDMANGNLESGDSDLVERLVGLFSYDNIDTDKLENTDVSAPLSVSPITDRQLAAFFSGIITNLMNAQMTEPLPYGIEFDDIMSLNQIIIRKGADMSAADKTYYSAQNGNVYLTLTASLNLSDMVEKMLNSPEMNMGGFKWVFDWLFPSKLFVSATVDINDADYDMVYEINHLGRYECRYKAVGASEAKTMTKMDRLVTVIDTVVNNLRQGEDFSLDAFVDSAMNGITPLLVKDDTAAFSLGNFIDLTSVSPSALGGNKVKIDLLGSFMEMMGEGLNLSAADIVTVMQALMCPDTDAMLKDAIGVALYPEASPIMTSAFVYKSTLYAPETPSLDDYDKDFIDGLIEEFGLELLQQLADDYGIETSYIDSETHEEIPYTLDDLKGAVGLGDPTPVSGQLKTAINEATDSIETPSLTITDRMLCAVIYSQIDSIGGDLADYGISMQKLAILKDDIDGVTHDFASVYCTFDLSALTGGDEFISEMINNLLGSRKMLINVTFDISMEASVTKVKPKPIINGLDGSTLNGLTTDALLDAILKLAPGFDVDAMFDEINEVLIDAIDSMGNNSIVGIQFAASV